MPAQSRMSAITAVHGTASRDPLDGRFVCACGVKGCELNYVLSFLTAAEMKIYKMRSRIKYLEGNHANKENKTGT